MADILTIGEPDTSARLSQNEAVLAVMVEHLEQEVSSLRYVLGGVLQSVYGRDRCDGDDLNDWPAFAMNSLYRERTSFGARQAKVGPFPANWLGSMARTGKSFAQVARSRKDAADRLSRALDL